jgi:hypothetical protein
MKRLFPVLCVLGLLLAGCGSKEAKPITGEETVEVDDFIESFPEVQLPIVIADTTLSKKKSDSALIPSKVFTLFVPDSVIKSDFGKTVPKIYALGRAREKNMETYLFVKAEAGSKRVGYLICFGKKNNYLRALPLVRTGFQEYKSAYGSLDKKFQITTYRETLKKTGEVSYKRNIYIYNAPSNEFTLILTEPNEDIIADIINPIDTLSQKNKYTGDYPYNKKNFISFRDGKTPSEILFFTHFEKSQGECVGELKGTARFTGTKKAVYKEVGNPCTIEFTFNNSSVVMKEVEGCGSYRNIKCFFNGTYYKKKRKKS